MRQNQSEIRIALPSKGRLADEVINMMSEANLQIYKPNPRQYKATIPNLPGLAVIFQRASDIVTSIRNSSVDFGITGWDIFREINGDNKDLFVLIEKLGFGHCSMYAIVPESWNDVQTMSDLNARQSQSDRRLRVATKFPNLTKSFFSKNGITNIEIISAEGALEIAPSIGYADVIVDLISTGTTLRDNRLKTLEDGRILSSQACLIANRSSLNSHKEVLAMAKQLIEFIVAYLRASENVSVFANIRGESAQSIAKLMHSKTVIGGLQGPTISRVISQDAEAWFAVHLIIRKDELTQAISEIREIGGSGVVVTPVTYIFEEEPSAYRNMLDELEV